MPEAPAVETSSKSPTQHLAFKPRQVALLQLRHLPVSMEQKRLSDEQKVLLLRSIAQFLEGSGFSKTLKKFRSEAQIQKQDSEDIVFDLEGVFCKFLEIGKKLESDKAVEVKFKESKKVKKSSDSLGHEKQSSGEACQPDDDSVLATVDKKSKYKKKKKNNSDCEHLVDNNLQPPPESLPIRTTDKAKDAPLSDSNNMTDSTEENQLKEKKKKKKKKLSSDIADKVEESISDGKDGADATIVLDDKNVGSKAKRKKKDTVVSENFSGAKIDDGKSDKIDSEKEGLKEKSMEDASEKQKKDSKKRKRLPIEEDAAHSAQEKAVEDSKRRTDCSEETTENVQSTKLKLSSVVDGNAHNEESSQGISTPKIDGHSNGNLKTNGEKSEEQTATKKQKNGSAEPKSVNRFQRVKVDEVVFSDERLQDNSYWAKGGAESGYGAKAESILGQVRGRDFRHEKTKKKRGSYRGGQIDENSHSFKFNYSDDE